MAIFSKTNFYLIMSKNVYSFLSPFQEKTNGTSNPNFSIPDLLNETNNKFFRIPNINSFSNNNNNLSGNQNLVLPSFPRFGSQEDGNNQKFVLPTFNSQEDSFLSIINCTNKLRLDFEKNNLTINKMKSTIDEKDKLIRHLLNQIKESESKNEVLEKLVNDLSFSKKNFSLSEESNDSAKKDELSFSKKNVRISRSSVKLPEKDDVSLTKLEKQKNIIPTKNTNNSISKKRKLNNDEDKDENENENKI